MPDSVLGVGKININHIFHTLNYLLVFYDTHIYIHTYRDTQKHKHIQK